MKKSLLVILFMVLLAGCSSTVNSPADTEEVVWAVKPQYDEAYGFAANLSAVKENGSFFFIDKSQQNVFDKEFSQIPRYEKDVKLFINQLPVVSVSQESDQQYLSRAGVRIDPTHLSTMIEPFRQEFRVARSENGLYGLVNVLGQWIVQPIFDEMKISEDGTPLVVKDSIWGFINDKGECMLVPEVSNIGNFVQGIAMAYVHNGKIGLTEYNFIDRNGNILFENNFTGAPPEYHDGIVCYKEDDLYGYMNLNGEVLIAPQFKYAGIFSEGLAAVTNLKNEIGYIDENGKILVEYRKGFYGGPFESGMASFAVKTFWGAVKEGVIDTSGKWLIKPIYDSVYYHKDANVWELDRGDKTDVYYVAQDEIVKGFSLIGLMTDNFFVGIKGEKEYIIYFSSGEPVWKGFDHVLDFSEGLFPVESGGKYGYVDTHGIWIYAPQFDNARSFSEGLAAVKQNGKWGFIANPLIYDEWIADEWERGISLGFYTRGNSEQNANPDDLLAPVACVLERITKEHTDISALWQTLDLDERGIAKTATSLTREDAAVISAAAAQYYGFDIDYLFAFLEG